MSKDDVTKTVTLFNETEEKFFGKSCKAIEEQGINNGMLLDLVKADFTFTVSGGRKTDESLVTEFVRKEDTICLNEMDSEVQNDMDIAKTDKLNHWVSHRIFVVQYFMRM